MTNPRKAILAALKQHGELTHQQLLEACPGVTAQLLVMELDTLFREDMVREHQHPDVSEHQYPDTLALNEAEMEIDE
jgi:hypothetical protein